MKITFLSNYLTHHQIPFCEAMYKALGDDFCFISCQPMESERVQGGWQLNNIHSYELKTYENNECMNLALKRTLECDVLICGSGDERLVKERQNKKKIIFRYSERIFKNGRYHALSPRAMRNILLNHTFKKNTFMLCASAYTAGDYGLLGAYQKKCFKWGYFPETKKYESIDKIIELKHPASILWVARLIEWKHPELPVLVSKRLKEAGISFELTIIGTGPLEKKINDMIEDNGLRENVKLLGSMAPEQVRVYMEQSEIFLFTSDFNEGWGAVLNEAMNSGCSVVASHAIGSVPYLIENQKNGLVFENRNIDDLFQKTMYLINNEEHRKSMGKNAYKTIAQQWNAENACNRLLNLFQAVMQDSELDLYSDGVCSRDGYLSNNWYRRKKT